MDRVTWTYRGIQITEKCGQTGPFTAHLKQRSLQKRIYFIRTQSEEV